MTHRALIAQVWGQWEDGNSQPLRTHISLIRRALGDGDSAPRVMAESRIGYRLVGPDVRRSRSALGPASDVRWR
jgi:DNA-binding winged helix-turn-helix (wHTH) protein